MGERSARTVSLFERDARVVKTAGLKLDTPDR